MIEEKKEKLPACVLRSRREGSASVSEFIRRAVAEAEIEILERRARATG